MALQEDTRTEPCALAIQVAAKMRNARKSRGLTLLDVAQRCGSTHQTIHRVETAKITISLEWVERIAQALGMLPESFFETNTNQGKNMEIEVTTKVKKQVRYLKAECGVRYWEDARVNGVEDTEGTLIPCREGDAWSPVIDLQTGKIENWPEGTVASIHYKVCDDGAYELRDPDGEVIKRITGYVIKMMCPEGNGYGDYVVMEINGDGTIQNWRVDLDVFEKDEDS